MPGRPQCLIVSHVVSRRCYREQVFVSFLQMSALTRSIDLNWPSWLLELMGLQGLLVAFIAGDGSTACLVRSSSLGPASLATFYVSAITPVVAFVVTWIGWTCAYVWLRRAAKRPNTGAIVPSQQPRPQLTGQASSGDSNIVSGPSLRSGQLDQANIFKPAWHASTDNISTLRMSQGVVQPVPEDSPVASQAAPEDSAAAAQPPPPPRKGFEDAEPAPNRAGSDRSGAESCAAEPASSNGSSTPRTPTSKLTPVGLAVSQSTASDFSRMHAHLTSPAASKSPVTRRVFPMVAYSRYMQLRFLPSCVIAFFFVYVHVCRCVGPLRWPS